MHNHKGAIATLLTLGLVVIGALITLGTSLFVNNRNTNLASNSMAAINCTPIRCSTGNKSYYRRGSAGDIFRNSDCTGELSYGTELNSYCTGGSGGGGNACSVAGGSCVSQSFSCTQVGGETARTFCLIDGGKKCCRSNTNTPTQPANDGSGTGDGTSGTVAENGVPNPEAACCFVSNAQSVNKCGTGVGYIRVYARAGVRVNSDMTTPCTSDAPPNGYGNAYGASKWFYCADSTVDGCENEAGYDLTVPIETPAPTDNPISSPEGVTPPFGCTVVPGTGCGIYRGSNSTAQQDVDGNWWCCPDDTLFVTRVPGGGTGRSGLLGKPCVFGDFNGQKNVYYCIDPKAKCTPYGSAGICVIPSAGGGGGNNGSSSTTYIPGQNCRPPQKTLRVGNTPVNIETADNVDNNYFVDCNHIRLDDAKSNIAVFRECPSNGQTCIYACFQGSKEVNCKDATDYKGGFWFSVYNKTDVDSTIIVRRTTDAFILFKDIVKAHSVSKKTNNIMNGADKMWIEALVMDGNTAKSFGTFELNAFSNGILITFQ